MNSVNLVGNLTRDPELRTTPSGQSVANLGIAVNDRKKTATGEWEDYAHFFNITCWGQLAENCAQYLTKGKKVGVSGKLEYRSWEQDGQKRSAVEITAFQIDFLTPKSESGVGGGGGSDEWRSAQPAATNRFVPAAASSSGDDDIPF